jgi:hypothetical protein
MLRVSLVQRTTPSMVDKGRVLSIGHAHAELASSCENSAGWRILTEPLSQFDQPE